MDLVLRDERIKAHLHLVQSLARAIRARPIGRGVELDDLVAYGAKGLVEAAARFDGARGIPFGAFAYRRIRGAIVDGIRAQHWFSRRAYHDLRVDLGGAADRPSNDTGGASLRRLGPRILYLEHVTGTEGQDWCAHVAEAGQARHDARWNGRRMVQPPIDEDDALEALAAAIRHLPDREQRLLDLCYCEGKTLSQAARVMGFSRSWACRLHARALATLRAAAKKHAPLPHGPSRLSGNQKHPGDSGPTDRRVAVKRNGPP